MAPKQLDIVYPSRSADSQRYACRDCPARCCKTWGVAISNDEAERIARDPEAVRRLAGRAPAILAAGTLPMRLVAGELSCVFLDDDQLCSLHKRHGHAFLPAACQAFPFGFSQNEHGAPLALLSRYCPSIADNYGEPIAKSAKRNLKLLGHGPALSDKMGLRSGRTLPKSQFVRLFELFRTRLESSEHIGHTIVELFTLTEAIDAALPRDHAPSDGEFDRILSEAHTETTPPWPSRSLSFNARVLFAHLLGAICYPVRVMQPFRATPISWTERMSALWVRMKWLLGFGSVRLLHVDAAVKLRRIEQVAPGLDTEVARDLGEYLREVLARRQGMTKTTYIHRVLVELGLMTLVASRYARARAASLNRGQVIGEDLRAGIGIAELLLTHQGQMGQSLVLDQLRLKLMSNPDDLVALLASEA